MTLRSFCRVVAALALATSASLISPLEALARTEAIRWTHASPADAQGFEAHVRAPDGSASQILSLSSATSPSAGVYGASVEVGDGDKLISVRAIGPGGIRSAWSTPPQLREGDPIQSGSPVGPGTPSTPTPGATSRIDFDTHVLGTSVAGWTDTRQNFSLQTDDSLFEVTSVGSNRVLHTDSSANDIHSHHVGGTNFWTDFELRGRMAIDRDEASIGVMTYSQYGASLAYYRLGRDAGQPFSIEGRPGALSCLSSGSPVTPQAGEWYRFKLDVQDMGTSNQVRAKVWRADAAEPSSYSLNCSDSSAGRPENGRIGVWSAGEGEKFWDDFEVIHGDGGNGGGGGTPSPPPAPILIQIVPVGP
jgi:hypothetical protein